MTSLTRRHARDLRSLYARRLVYHRGVYVRSHSCSYCLQRTGLKKHHTKSLRQQARGLPLGDNRTRCKQRSFRPPQTDCHAGKTTVHLSSCRPYYLSGGRRNLTMTMVHPSLLYQRWLFGVPHRTPPCAYTFPLRLKISRFSPKGW